MPGAYQKLLLITPILKFEGVWSCKTSGLVHLVADTSYDLQMLYLSSAYSETNSPPSYIPKPCTVHLVAGDVSFNWQRITTVLINRGNGERKEIPSALYIKIVFSKKNIKIHN